MVKESENFPLLGISNEYEEQISYFQVKNLKALDFLLDGRYILKKLETDNSYQKCELTNEYTSCCKAQLIDDFSHAYGDDREFVVWEGFVNEEIIDALEEGKLFVKA